MIEVLHARSVWHRTVVLTTLVSKPDCLQDYQAKLVEVESRNPLVICKGIDCGKGRMALFTPLPYVLLI